MYVYFLLIFIIYNMLKKKEREESENVDQFNLVESNDIH